MDEKIKANIEESNKLVSEYNNLNDKIYNRNGFRMTELEKLLDIINKEFMELVKQKVENQK